MPWLCVVVACSAFGGAKVDAFCAAWTAASANARDSDEAIEKTLETLHIVDPPPFTWEAAVLAVSHASPDSRLLILRNAAKDLGEEFKCPAFEFPGGAPRHQLELADVSGAVAFAADDAGFVVLEERHSTSGAFVKAVLRSGSKIVFDGLGELGARQVLLSAKSVVLIGSSEIVVVPRSGGSKPVTLMKRAAAGGFTVDKNELLFMADSKLQAIPLSGGAPRVIATLPTDGSSLNAFIRRLPSGFVVSTDAGTFCITGAKVNPFPRISSESIVVGADLYSSYGAPSEPPRKSLFGGRTRSAPKPPLGLYRFTCGAEPVRVSDDFDLTQMVVRNGVVFGVARFDWYGKQQLLRFKPGQEKPTLVAEPLGDARGLSAGGKRLYWLDAWFGAVYSAPAGD